MPIKSSFQFFSNGPDDILRKIVEERNAKLLAAIKDISCPCGHENNQARVVSDTNTKPVVEGCCEGFVEAAKTKLKELGLLP